MSCFIYSLSPLKSGILKLTTLFAIKSIKLDAFYLKNHYLSSIVKTHIAEITTFLTKNVYLLILRFILRENTFIIYRLAIAQFLDSQKVYYF